MNSQLNLEKYSIALVLTLCTSFAGCSSDDVQDALQSPASQITASELQHSWQSEKCSEPLLLVIVGSSSRTVYHFSGNKVDVSQQLYNSANCTNDVGAIVTYSGTFEKKAEVTPDVFQIDITLTSASVVAVSEKGRQVLSDVRFCGVENWTINAPVDLTANTRDANCPLATVPSVAFDIYKVEGTLLFFGKGIDKSSIANRPAEIERGLPFNRL